MNINFNLLKIGILLLSASGAQAQPSIGGFNVYYGHLHNHSNVSDGTGTPDEAYNYAKNTGGLDFFSLSDHSTAIDATEWLSIKTAANKYNSDNVFTTFYGFEWTENVLGHVTVIYSTDYISIGSPTNTFAGLCNWLNNNECVAFFNHPGRNNSTGREFEHFTTTPTDKIAGMELWNKADRFPVYYYTDGYYAADGNKSWFDEAISRGWKIGAAGGEDNHSGTWGTATTSRLAVLASAKNRTEIYNALKAKRFFTTYDKNLALSFKIGSNEMGSTITSLETSFTIQATDANGETFTQVQLLKNGAVLNTWTPNSSTVNISGNMIFTTGEYYYVRVLQTDKDEAISSPIWIGNANQLPTVSLTAPLQNSNFVAPAAITISATASDPDGNIQKVEFYQGATKIGEDTSSPFSFEWSGVSSGSYSLTAKAFDNVGGTAVSSAFQILVTNPGDPVTISSKIATGLDDMEESSTGNTLTNVNSTDIELVYDASTSAGIQVVGLRFVNLNIPQGALISNAYIQFTCDEISTDACNLTISGENVDNSLAFTTADFNVSNRTKTIARVNWIPAAWQILDEAGINQRTPNISPIIQEIVSRTGYVSTGAISLIFNGTGARIADSYDGSPTQAAVLYVTYTISTENQPPVVSITSPLNNATFTEPATISISANATDIDGSITKVDFFQGSTLLGSDNTGPFIYNWTNVIAGTYLLTAVATDNFGATATTAFVSVTVNPAPVIRSMSSRINTASDDVEESLKGSVVLNGDDIELVYDTKNTGSQVVGLRFNTISIPQGANITKAYIQFTVDEKTTAGCNLTIKGENSDNTATFTTASRNVSNRTLTTNNVGWVPAGWSTVGLAGVAQQTPDVKAIVQEIVDRPNWSSGNSLAFIITGTGNGKRTAVSYETSSAKAAMLYIEYLEPSLKSGSIQPANSEMKGEKELFKTETALKCYPNPVNDIMHIELINSAKEKLTFIEIMNVAGIQVKSQNISGVKTQILIDDLPSGIFFVRIQTSDKMYLRKIVKR